ncbi:hypothetical protein CIK69_01565 [Brachybacterium alimentarium]|uniref:hypothetical protein n=1 Tax=Brachybacterium alimentarium TaxID=47845 RepID=UPI000DF1552A|nr:hypothetical protein [Brachybacterium alimentarium]RCS93540.1 hypothetical protein CIK69_01565 [Brachybacterium alimentarium]
MRLLRHPPSGSPRVRSRLAARAGLAAFAVLAAMASVLVPWPVLGTGLEQNPSTAASRTFVITCDGSAAIEPTSYILTCADAGMGLDALQWSDWGSEHATARGILRTLTCDPSCAEGGTAEYSVEVVATDARAEGPVTGYETLEVTYSGTPPEWAPSGTDTFDITPAPTTAAGGAS